MSTVDSTPLAISVRIAAPPAMVYRALVDGGALRGWLAEHAEVSVAEGRFEFWGRYTPQGEPGRQHLLAVEPGRLLWFAWTLDGVETAVEITLAPDGERHTVLALSQTGAPTLEEMMAPAGRRDGLHTLHTFWGLALANLAAYAEGRELMPHCDFRTDRANEIRVELTIGAPPEEVFASLIDPARIARWFGWQAEVEPWVGGRMTLGADGKIFELEPGRTLGYADTDGTVVRWELAGSGGKTHLTFVHSGFTDDERDSVAQHEAGWLGGLAELKRMHELGDEYHPRTVDSRLPGEERA